MITWNRKTFIIISIAFLLLSCLFYYFPGHDEVPFFIIIVFSVSFISLLILTDMWGAEKTFNGSIARYGASAPVGWSSYWGCWRGLQGLHLEGSLYLSPDAECVKVLFRLNPDCLLKCNRCGAIETMLLDQSFSNLFRVWARWLDHEILSPIQRDLSALRHGLAELVGTVPTVMPTGHSNIAIVRAVISLQAIQ